LLEKSLEKFELSLDKSSIYSLTFVSMLTEVGENYPEINLRVEDYVFKCCMIFIMQLMIIWCIYKTIKDGDGKFMRPSLLDMSLRISTCYLFHIQN